MLAEIIEKYKVVNSVGNTIGRVKDIFIDTSTWKIEGFEVSPGALRKDFLIKTGEVVKFDQTDRIIIVNDNFEEEEVPKIPRKNMYPFEELKKHIVVDKDGKKIGKIYNLEIPYEKLKMFKVWKLMVKTGFSERRLRLSPSEVEEVMEQISLKGSTDEYKEDLE